MSHINFKLPLRRGPLGSFDMNDNTRSAVKENVKLTILTNVGERLINNVGSTISLNIFENNENLRENVFSKFQDIFDKFFNFLTLDDVLITTNIENKSLDSDQAIVTIKYSFKGIEDIQDEISILIG